MKGKGRGGGRERGEGRGEEGKGEDGEERRGGEMKGGEGEEGRSGFDFIDLIQLYFSTMKILAQRPTHISAVATALLIAKTFIGRGRRRGQGRTGAPDRLSQRRDRKGHCDTRHTHLKSCLPDVTSL